MMRFLAGKRLVWTTYFRLFTDNGQPKFRIIPRFRRLHYSKHWGMKGFAVYLWGREFNFSFGKDKKDFYGFLKAMQQMDEDGFGL